VRESGDDVAVVALWESGDDVAAAALWESGDEAWSVWFVTINKRRGGFTKHRTFQTRTRTQTLDEGELEHILQHE
jgi:hypothetical protein